MGEARGSGLSGSGSHARQIQVSFDIHEAAKLGGGARRGWPVDR